MKKRSIFTLVLSLSLTAVIGIGSTLAYLTAQTATRVNTFTVGKVNMTLTEPNWDAASSHILVPGVPIDKDPTITVEQNSEDAYVFVKAVYPTGLENYYNSGSLFGVDPSDWKIVYSSTLDSTNSVAIAQYIGQGAYVPKNTAGDTAITIFTQVGLNSEVTTAQASSIAALNPSLTLTSYAIQKAAVDSAALAGQLSSLSNVTIAANQLDMASAS